MSLYFELQNSSLSEDGFERRTYQDPNYYQLELAGGANSLS